MPLFSSPQLNRFRPERLFQPGSILLIGGETDRGARIKANLAAGQAGSPIRVEEWSGAGPFATADLAVLASEPDNPTATLCLLAERGIFAAVVTTPVQGLAAAAQQSGVRVLGPSSFGIAVPALGLQATLSHMPVPAGGAALVAQSPSLCRAVIDWAGPNGLGFTHVIGIGGNVGTGFALALDWLARDPGTRVILLEIRRLRDSRAFLSAARAAARLRPVVALRSGGRLTDPTGLGDAAFEAALRRAGILCVSGLEDWLAAAETLTRAKPARGESLAIVSNAIGPGEMAADAALRGGLTLADLPATTRSVLEIVLPPELASTAPGAPIFVGVDNPTRLAEAAAMLSAAPEVGGVLAVHAPEPDTDATSIEALAACAAAAKLPMLVCVMGETTGAGHRARLAERGAAVFSGPEQAVRGFQQLVQHRRNRAAARELPPSTVLNVAPDRERVRRLFERVRQNRRSELRHAEAMAVLSAYGIPTVPTRAAATEAEAGAAAAMLGFPAVLKRTQDQFPHSLAVQLDLPDTAAVRAAVRRLGHEVPDAQWLVQRQVVRARELRIQVWDDGMFGPVIGFGKGGTAADLLADMAVDLPPLNLPLAAELVSRTRVARTLVAFRDRPAVDQEALANALVRVSQLIVDFPEIARFDCNPLFADAGGVTAADAGLWLREPGQAGVLSIAPYPVEWVERWNGAGEWLTIRPIRPEDAEAHGTLFSRLGPEDVRFRFFSPMRVLPPEQMVRMTQVDYAREMAFIAVREATGETIGVARLVREAGSQSGEFAIVMQPDAKGRGIATHMMQRICSWARSQGMTEIVGQILADNQPMLAFVRHLGFSIRRLIGEDDVMEARLALEPQEPPE